MYRTKVRQWRIGRPATARIELSFLRQATVWRVMVDVPRSLFRFAAQEAGSGSREVDRGQRAAWLDATDAALTAMEYALRRRSGLPEEDWS